MTTEVSPTASPIDLEDLASHAATCVRIYAICEVNPTELAALVAAVKALQRVRACRTSKGWTIGGHPGLTQLLPEMDAALQPFTGSKPEPELEMIPRRWSRDDDEDLQSLMDRDMGDS